MFAINKKGFVGILYHYSLNHLHGRDVDMEYNPMAPLGRIILLK